MNSLPKPTEAELCILRVLWRRGPSTVRQVFEELEAGTGYTTALKTMQIMTEKKLLVRDQSNRSHVYRAAAQEEQTLGLIVGDLFERAMGGSWRKLLVAALSTRKASDEELSEMRQVLDEAERGGKKQAKPTRKGQS